MKYIHFSDEVVFGDVRNELCSDNIHNSIFHCHLQFSSSCFPLNLFSPNLVEIVCVVSTESGSRWGERGGIQSSKWQNIIMQRKCICCGHFPAVINKNNVGMENHQGGRLTNPRVWNESFISSWRARAVLWGWEGEWWRGLGTGWRITRGLVPLPPSTTTTS